MSHPELQSSNKIWVWYSSRGSYTISWSWLTLPDCCAIMHNNLHEKWMLHHIIWRGWKERNSVYHYCPCVLLSHLHLANLYHWMDSLQAQYCSCKSSGVHMVTNKTTGYNSKNEIFCRYWQIYIINVFIYILLSPSCRNSVLLLLRDLKTSLFCEKNPNREGDNTSMSGHVVGNCREHELHRMQSLSLD